jgi:hypothetical protein
LLRFESVVVHGIVSPRYLHLTTFYRFKLIKFILEFDGNVEVNRITLVTIGHFVSSITFIKNVIRNNQCFLFLFYFIICRYLSIFSNINLEYIPSRLSIISKFVFGLDIEMTFFANMILRKDPWSESYCFISFCVKEI